MTIFNNIGTMQQGNARPAGPVNRTVGAKCRIEAILIERALCSGMAQQSLDGRTYEVAHGATGYLFGLRQRLQECQFGWDGFVPARFDACLSHTVSCLSLRQNRCLQVIAQPQGGSSEVAISRYQVNLIERRQDGLAVARSVLLRPIIPGGRAHTGCIHFDDEKAVA